MQISGRFSQNLINTNVSFQKKDNTAVQKPTLAANSVQVSSLSEDTSFYTIPLLFTAYLLVRKNSKLVDKARLDVERTINAANIPKKFQITDEQAKELIIKAQEKALANTNAKFSGASHGMAGLIINVVKKTTTIVKGNLEINRAKTFCGELQLISDLMDSNRLNQLRAIAISRPNITGKAGDWVTPCSNCRAEFNALYKTGKFKNFKYVQYVIPEQGKENKIKLKIMTLRDLLPQIDEQIPSLTNKSIKALVKDSNIHLSESAKNNKDKNKLLSNSEIEKLLISAKRAYDTNNNAGAAVLTEAGEIFKGFKAGPKARMSDPADKVALINAIMNSKNQKLRAIAIYERDNTLPSIENLSWFSHPNYGANPYIILIKNDKILIRTIEDYMPYMHKCSKSHSLCCNV